MDRFGLAATALAVLAIVVVCTVLAGRTAKAFSNIAMGMLMIGVAATIFANPLGELVGPDGLLAKGRDTGLEIATSVSDGAMSKQGDGANVDQMVSRLADRFLRSPTQMINFGAVADSISRKCREAWSQGHQQRARRQAQRRHQGVRLRKRRSDAPEVDGQPGRHPRPPQHLRVPRAVPGGVRLLLRLARRQGRRAGDAVSPRWPHRRSRSA